MKNGLVEDYLNDCKGIAWDTCHKIYILMDDKEMELMASYGYDPLIYANTTTPNEMLYTLIDWYDSSCMLRFIEAVKTNLENPNAGFISVVEQGEEWFI